MGRRRIHTINRVVRLDPQARVGYGGDVPGNATGGGYGVDNDDFSGQTTSLDFIQGKIAIGSIPVVGFDQWTPAWKNLVLQNGAGFRPARHIGYRTQDFPRQFLNQDPGLVNLQHKGWLPAYKTINSDEIWFQARRNPHHWTRTFWGNLGRTGRWEFVRHKDNGAAAMGGGEPLIDEFNPVIVSPGDYILIVTDAPDGSGGFQHGSLSPIVKIGSSRSGNADAGNYSATKTQYSGLSCNVQVIDPEHCIAKIPYGAKTGFLRVISRKGVMTWMGTVRNDLGVIWSQKNDVPIPIFVMDHGQAICEEAYQSGKTYVDGIQDSQNPYGALTNTGDTVLIGANGFQGQSNLLQGPYAGAGSYWPMGFSDHDMHYVNAWAKEMTFRTSQASGVGVSNGLIASYLLGVQASMLTPVLAMVTFTAALGYFNIGMSMIAHSLGQASGGGSAFRLHRMHKSAGDGHPGSYVGDGAEDVTMARDSQFGYVTFAKKYDTNVSSSVSTNMFMDFARTRHIVDNDKHDSMARERGATTVLNCAGAIDVLNSDGSLNRKMIVAHARAAADIPKNVGIGGPHLTPNVPCGLGHAVPAPDYTDQDANALLNADFDRWIRHGSGYPGEVVAPPNLGNSVSLLYGPGKDNSECTFDKGEGYWFDNAGAGVGAPIWAEKHDALGNLDYRKNVYGAGAVWVYPWDSATNTNRFLASFLNRSTQPGTAGRPLGNGPRFFTGMTPLTSPPYIRNLSREVGAHEREMTGVDNFDLTRSEGLGLGGTLWYPRFWSQSVGRGHLTIVSSSIYDENFRCLKCSSTAWGKDFARYCMDNKSALGYGGWFLGEKSKPGFWIEGKALRRGVNDLSVADKVTRWAQDQNIEWAAFTEKKDRFKHDSSKHECGLHLGGWPRSLLRTAGAFERQPGQACKTDKGPRVQEKDATHLDGWLNHPYQTTDPTKVGQLVGGDLRDNHGHKYEYWEAGCIPTFVKNEVSAMDIYSGNAKKYDKMRNVAELKLTEKNDLIQVVGTMTLGDWEKADWKKITTVGPQHEFQAGDVAVIRISPNTTRTACPTKCVRMRHIHPFYQEKDEKTGAMVWYSANFIRPWNVAGPLNISDYFLGWAGGPQPRGVVPGNADNVSFFKYYTIGSVSDNAARGPAACILTASANPNDGNWAWHMRNGDLGKPSQCSMNWHMMDSLRSRAGGVRFNAGELKRRWIGHAQGAIIGHEQEPESDEYIDGWNFMIKTRSVLAHNNLYVHSFFRDLERVTFGRNGRSCRWKKVFTLPPPNQFVSGSHRLHQQIAIRLPEAMYSGSGTPLKAHVNGVVQSDTLLSSSDRCATTDYLWLYFEDVDNSTSVTTLVQERHPGGGKKDPKTQAFLNTLLPREDKLAEASSSGYMGGGAPSTSYISLSTPITMYNPNKQLYEHRNTSSKIFGPTPAYVKQPLHVDPDSEPFGFEGVFPPSASIYDPGG